MGPIFPSHGMVEVPRCFRDCPMLREGFLFVPPEGAMGPIVPSQRMVEVSTCFRGCPRLYVLLLDDRG